MFATSDGQDLIDKPSLILLRKNTVDFCKRECCLNSQSRRISATCLSSASINLVIHSVMATLTFNFNGSDIANDFLLNQAIPEANRFLNQIGVSFTGTPSGNNSGISVTINNPDNLVSFLNGLTNYLKPAPVSTQLVVFGDSLSDPGNLFALTNGQAPPSPPYFNGRFSNGPIWVDYLTSQFGLNANSIKNYAVGGAKTGRDNIGNAQLGANLLPGLLNEIDTYAATTPSGAKPNTVYVVWAGGDDLLNISDPASAPTVVNDAIANITTAITKLASLGAQDIIVPNSIDLGFTPQSVRSGVAGQATAVSTAFNQALDQSLTNLEQSLHINVSELDLFTLSRRVFAAPEEFGFTNITDPLIEQVNPVNPNGYFWWDTVHPTTQVHQIVANAFNAVINQPANGSTSTSSVLSNLNSQFRCPLTVADSLKVAPDTALKV